MVKVRLVAGGVSADIHPELPEIMRMDAGQGMTASMGLKDGRMIIRSLEMSKDVSISGAEFAAKAAIDRHQKGKCKICEKAEELLKSGKSQSR